MPIPTAHWLSAVTVEGDDWATVLQVVSNTYITPSRTAIHAATRVYPTPDVVLKQTGLQLSDGVFQMPDTVERLQLAFYRPFTVNLPEKSFVVLISPGVSRIDASSTTHANVCDRWSALAAPQPGVRRTHANAPTSDHTSIPTRALAVYIVLWLSRGIHVARNFHCPEVCVASPKASLAVGHRFKSYDENTARQSRARRGVFALDARGRIILIAPSLLGLRRGNNSSQGPWSVRGRGDVMVRILASHLGESNSIPGRVATGFFHVGIVLDNAAGRRVFSGISRFLCPCILALLHKSSHLAIIRPQDLDAHCKAGADVFPHPTSSQGISQYECDRPPSSDQLETASGIKNKGKRGELIESELDETPPQALLRAHCGFIGRTSQEDTQESAHGEWNGGLCSELTQVAKHFHSILSGTESETTNFVRSFFVENQVISTGTQRQGGGREIPEKTLAASSGTIPTCENPGATPPGISTSVYSYISCRRIQELFAWRLCVGWRVSIAISNAQSNRRATKLCLRTRVRQWRPAVAEQRLQLRRVQTHARLPPKANRVQYPAGSPDFRKWESCRTMPLVGGFSRGSPVSPAPYSLQSPSSTLETSLFRATQISSLTPWAMMGRGASTSAVSFPCRKRVLCGESTGIIGDILACFRRARSIKVAGANSHSHPPPPF
ncbi:hypothetical protein PR048_026342 [Dryococelus australis]|uniref:Uncharacterized protein n=1 Tax=Dryococelus australis TaxID=614101 RepID=A0ABQ9GL27_9NEOP|nr:hypothetical protein PR048_026342 [Dryococelus australis]